MQRIALILATAFYLFGLSGVLSKVEAQTLEDAEALSSFEEIVPIFATASRNEIPAIGCRTKILMATEPTTSTVFRYHLYAFYVNTVDVILEFANKFNS